MGPKVKRLRCAIYTRKSSEEGLEQAFNSLAAQRDACIAQLLSGEMSSLRRIAAAVGKSERYVSKVIRAAFLAPDLLAAVLERRVPTQLTLAELTKYLTWDWDEQRRRFAVVVGANRTSQHSESAACNS